MTTKEDIKKDDSFGFTNKDYSKTAVGDKMITTNKYYIQFYKEGDYKGIKFYNTKQTAINKAKKFTEV